MRKFITISILFILLLYLTAELYSFIENKRWNKQIKENAVYIANNINTGELRTFKEWNCGTRGQMQLWQKNDLDKISIRYYQDNDSTIVFLNKDAMLSLGYKIDTSKFKIEIFELTKKQNDKINLIGYNSEWEKTSLEPPTDSIFQNNLNPFELVHKLSKIKLKYNISASNYKTSSEIIKFFLSNQHVLYYIPNLKNAENIKIKKLIIIKNKWYFEKLDRPLDNG